jgi:protein-S-isoprenylcysteine O-methyltransferase Ste14
VTFSPQSLARWIVALTYLRLLIGAARAFKPIERNGGSLPLVLTFLAMLVAKERVELSLPLALPALAILIAALALFQWAANSIRGQFFSYIGSHDTPQFVFQSGPFAHIRHPFYTSYLLTHTAVTIAFPSWFTLAITLISIAALTRSAIFEERKFETSPNAAEYQTYIARTGRFFPKL